MHCLFCTHKEPAMRYRHYLEDFRTEEELKEHNDQIDHRIIEWRRDMIHNYGGYVDDQDNPVSPWAAYRHELRKYLAHKTGRWGIEPEKPRGRHIALLMFRAMLTQAKTDYASAFLELSMNCTEDSIKTDDGWKDFKALLHDYERGLDSENFGSLKTVPKLTRLAP